jgi:hypothetical protein
VIENVKHFLTTIAAALLDDASFTKRWEPGGPLALAVSLPVRTGEHVLTKQVLSFYEFHTVRLLCKLAR